jgi:hypothetical protein
MNEKDWKYLSEKAWEIRERVVKMPAPNERFCESGGVARPKGSANLQVLCPAQTAVSRRLREAAATLCATRVQQA